MFWLKKNNFNDLSNKQYLARSVSSSKLEQAGVLPFINTAPLISNEIVICSSAMRIDAY